MASTDVVKQQVQAAAASNGSGQPTVVELIQRQRPAIEMALPKHLNTDRFTRIALTCIRTTPKLAECSTASLLGALMVSAQLGLEPGGPLGQAYLVPFKGEVTFILGYKGIIELARRSGQVSSVNAHEVCENDDFEYAYGTDSFLRHKPKLGDRGKAFAYYAVVKFKDGGHEFVVLGRDDVEKRRQRSAGKDRGPWVTDYDAMARKTCIRALAPYLPLSPELERAIGADERTFTHIDPDMTGVPAIEGPPAGVTDDGEIVYDAEPVE